MKKMMQLIQPYPEAQNKANFNKTALHLAAINGQWKKLKVILQNINRRYQNKDIKPIKKN
jgi:hypothetical protein